MHKIGFLCSEKPLDGERAVLAEKGITDVELYDVPCDEHRVPLPDSLKGTEGLVVEWGSVPAWVFKETRSSNAWPICPSATTTSTWTRRPSRVPL